jgi:chromosome segregation ATPase
LNALERVGRKRRDRRMQTQPEPPFAVESCECLTDGPFALLRVSGTGVSAPTTLVGEGDSPESFEPLPQPGAASADGTWRIAFALPAELGVPGTRLWLHDGGVYLAELVVPAVDEPTPVAPAAQRVAEPRGPEDEPASAEEQEDPRARKLVEAWAEAANLREKLSEREEELAGTLKELLDARHNVQPLRERAEELTIELASVQTERESATDKAAELEAVRAQLAQAETSLAEAERARKEAQREAAAARDEVTRLERELASARVAVETAIRDAQRQLDDARGEAAAAQARLTAEAEEHQQTAEKLRTKVTKLEEGKARRRGVGRRSDDLQLQQLRAELEGQITERERRINQLEHEAETFTQRRDEAVTESVRARIGQLEEEVRQHTSCNEDLRSLLESERELMAAARREAQELKRQLASAKASRVADTADRDAEDGAPTDKPVVKPPTEQMPWSALDDELLARIEKAKALTG